MLVGRDAERQAIDDLLRAAQAQMSSALVVVGEPGIGKTALLGYASSQRGALGLLHASGVEVESHLPYAGLLDVLGPSLDLLPEISESGRHALESALGLSVGSSPTPFAVAAATLQLLSAATDRRGQLLLLDDLQWLDQASVAALLFAVRRLRESNLGTVIAVRTGSAVEQNLRDFNRISLTGLGEHDADRLLGTVGGGFAPSAVRRLTDLTGGNPLAIIEIGGQLDLRQRAGTRPIGLSLEPAPLVQQGFRSLVGSLPPETQFLMTVMLVDPVADEATLARVSRHLGLAEDALAPAIACGLVARGDGQLRFRHPLIRVAVSASATTSDRRRAHAALGEVLDPVSQGHRRAWHLAEAAEEPDELIASLLEVAADDAREKGDLSTAARLYARAAHLSTELEGRQNLRIAAGTAATLAGLPGGPASLEEARSTAIDEEQRMQIDSVLSRYAAWAGDRDGVERIAARASPSTPPLHRAHLHANALTTAWHPWDRGAVRRHADEVTKLVDGRTGSGVTFPAIAILAAELLTSDRPVASSERLVDDFLASPDADLACPLTFTLIGLGRLEEADRVLDPALEIARATAAIPVLAWLRSVQSGLLLLRGNVPGAIAAAEEGIDLGAALANDLLQAQGYGWLSMAESAAGDEVRCRAHGELAIAGGAATQTRTTIATAELALVRLDLSRGDAGGAVHRSLILLDEMRAHGLSTSTWLPILPEAIEALVRDGRTAEAEVLIDDLATQSDLCGLPSQRAALKHCRVLVAPRGELDTVITEAMAARDAAPDPIARARTLLCHGERLRRLQRRSDAREPLNRALSEFRRMGLRLWAGTAERELAAAGAQPGRRPKSDDNALTPQEQRVAELAATGASTRDIAAAFFVSHKTVEAQLTQVYRKLGIRGRAQLAHLASSRPAGDPD